MELDTTKLRQTGFRKTVTHDNCVVLDIGSSSYPRYIEVRPPGDDGSRMTAIWDGSLELAVNDKVKCIEYGGNPVWAISAMGGDDSAVGKVRVSKVWESDFGNVALQADATGQIEVGKTTGPDAKFEVLDTAGVQFRLTFEDGVKFADFELNTNHDLIIKPSSTGQIKLQPTTDSIDFFQVLDADGGAPIVNVDSVNEALTINTTTSQHVSEGTTISSHLYIERRDVGALRGAVYSAITDTATRSAQNEFLRARAGSAAVTVNDTIGEFLGAGHDGTDYNRSARFRFLVDGAVSANTVPMAITFGTSETNTSGLTERARISSNGRMGIGATVPSGQMQINQKVTDAAIPVLYLRQLDVSEEIIEFDTTIGTGNAIEAVGAKALTVTHFIKCTLPGGLTRYWPVGTIA